MRDTAVISITIALPEALLARLDMLVPPEQQSQFIAEAVDRLLILEEQLTAINESAGIWRDENHPDMLSDTDIDNWLKNLRSSW
ncbi:MAG TPA: hypothetical protein ENJ93_00105 [Chloroflexi bacterium]|nr:hypothetical protein [Chloroflexota bacterium]